MWSRLQVRWGNPTHVTSPTWGPPPSCKQALSFTFRQIKWTVCKKWKGNSEKFQLLIKSFLWFRISYSRNWECLDQSCVNRTESVHGTLRFPFFFISPIVWNMCENLHYESVYFTELHNDQEYYWPTIYRVGAAIVSTITSYIFPRRAAFHITSIFFCRPSIWGPDSSKGG